MRKSQTDKKRLVPLILCSVLVLQQSFMNQANASNITDGNGVAIDKHPATGSYEIRPDAWNGKVGFKEFQDLQLSQGDILNFIFQAYYQKQEGTHTTSGYWDVDTFVNFINNRAEINGIVNAIKDIGGNIKQDGNLVFISPNGMVVGSSGVLNVGSLQVLTPTKESFNNLKSGVPVANRDSKYGASLATEITKEWDPNAVVLGNGNITIDGRILARENAEFSGGNVNFGNGSILLAGVGGNTEVFQNKEAADTLFTSLVNADNMNTGNGFANSNGKIVITSNVGTNIGEGAKVRNFASKSDTTITNTGSEGITIAGEVSNPNGTLSVTNKAGGINVTSTGLLKNKGEMIIKGQDADTGIVIDGTVINDGNLTITETTASGTTGIQIGGDVTNNTGVTNITNTQSGGLFVTAGGNVTSNGTNLNMTNTGTDGFVIDGNVTNNSGVADLVNQANKFDINGTVTGAGDELNISNSGTNGLNIAGLVDNNKGTANISNTAGGLNVLTDGQVINDGTSLTMTNDGEDGFIIDGAVTNNNGIAELVNNTNTFDINGTVTGAGNQLNITNNGTNGLNIKGLVANNKGIADISNTAGGLNILTDGKVTNDGTSLTMTNDGEDGFIVDGQVINNAGDALLVNQNNKFDINGSVTSNSNGTLEISNSGDNGLNIKGTVKNTNASGTTLISNTKGGLHVTTSGSVISDGSILNMTNSGAGGFTVDGTINNNAGKAILTNSNGKMLVSTTGNINSKGTELNVTNTGAGGMHIQGHVTHKNTAGKVNFTNLDSDMVIGHDSNDFNITSDADVNIKVQDGNLLNYGVASTLIRTTDNADLNINALNGSIGEDLGLCDGGVCTGVGPGERDLTKSINTEIDGRITADSHGTGALINMASLDKDMHINKIDSDGRVILLADDKVNKGATAYDIINSADDNSITPNIKGSGISVIASGDIGKTDNKITFIQTGANVDIANENDDASAPHDLYETPIHTGDGVEFLAIGNIDIKGLDNADGTKNDTNVCTIASRTGTVNAEFSGNTYIRDITAQNEVNVVNRGTEIYIENLGGAPSRYAETGDYYGTYDSIVPERATIKALDLGTVENPNLVPNSTIVVKNGTINGKGSTSHPGLDQDVTVTADNAYIGGYYFNMGKHRGNGLSQVTKDDHTNTLVNAGDPDTPVSIRGKAVRPDDVTEIDRNPVERIYYYADIDGDGEPDEGSNGSGQKDDPTYDPDKEPADDLVVPEPGDDDDDDGPDPGDDDDDDDDDDGPDPPNPGDDDDDDDDDGPTMDDAKRTWKKEISDNISVIDKRQYMRFDIDGNPNPVVFESEPTVDGILNISRGGVLLSHNKTLKVGDVVPVHIKYGDVEINTNVKIVSASDVTAGGEFMDLDLATANKLLYLSLLMDETMPKDQYYANTNDGSLSTTGVDD